MCVMARDDPHFRLRIPADLKEKIEVFAKANNRSINAEIVSRLEGSFHSSPVEIEFPGEPELWGPVLQQVALAAAREALKAAGLPVKALSPDDAPAPEQGGEPKKGA